ncbi:MAG: magnesium and cobalt transport protein CorA [Alphaproteobacteria bacterium]|nr:magnesium and cobalt transport protein CorA [Alphaproteobacteria bacterium]
MPVIRVTGYGPNNHFSRTVTSVDEIQTARGQAPIVWVDVQGLGDADFVARLGDLFGLHRLALEDVLQLQQRPKIESYDSNVFMILRLPEPGRQFATEQISIFLGRNFVITCQEHPGDCFDPVRTRLVDAHGRLRIRGADYLAYALIDATIDAYFPVLEVFGERVDELEQEVLESNRESLVEDVHDLKRDLLLVRRAIWPHRELVNNMIRDEHELVEPHTVIFLRDCYDHLVQLMDITETYR